MESKWRRIGVSYVGKLRGEGREDLFIPLPCVH
jgi:hypothetical protein